jgi:DNA-binding response OmpR family regulator
MMDDLDDLFAQALGRPREAYDRSIDVHVSNLRKKIQKADKEESYIKTVWGIGFKLE